MVPIIDTVGSAPAWASRRMLGGSRAYGWWELLGPVAFGYPRKPLNTEPSGGTTYHLLLVIPVKRRKRTLQSLLDLEQL